MEQSTPSLASKMGEAAVDVAAVCGTGLITYGVNLVYHPAAFIVGGAFLLTGAWLVARKSAD